jgi:hypothetical protein
MPRTANYLQVIVVIISVHDEAERTTESGTVQEAKSVAEDVRKAWRSLGSSLITLPDLSRKIEPANIPCYGF